MLGLVLCWLPLTVSASTAEPGTEASEKVVYFYAWGGSESVNAYLRWVQEQLAAEEGIRLQHVKVADIAEAVTLLLAEGRRRRAKSICYGSMVKISMF